MDQSATVHWTGTQSKSPQASTWSLTKMASRQKDRLVTVRENFTTVTSIL